MESILCPSPTVADSSDVLNGRQHLLAPDGLGIVQRVIVCPNTLGHFWLGRPKRVQGDQNVAVLYSRDMLQYVHVIGKTDRRDI